MTKKTKIALLAIIVLIIAGMAFYPYVKKHYFTPEEPDSITLQSRASQTTGRNSPLSVSAQVIKYNNLDDVFRQTATLIPDEEVDLSFETSGKITHIYFKEGTSVTKGTLLAKVNDNTLQAELKKLEAQIPLAEDRVYRQKALLAKDAVSQEAYESVTTELEKLKADIDLVKARIEQTELRAPFDGIIGLRQVSEGTYATPSTIISRLTKTTPLKIEFSVNQAFAGEIQSGERIKFTLNNDDRVYEATIFAVESRLDGSTLTLRVRAIYDNPGGHLMPGRSAVVEVKLKEIRNAILVPSLSVVAEMGRDIAYIYKDGRAQLVTITKGMRTESAIQVVSGLSIGDTLLTTGVMQLRDGLPVVINQIEE